jgi:serine/threonine kinase 4
MVFKIIRLIRSLGITCIELAEGEPPFSHIHPVRAMFVIKKNPPSGLTNPRFNIYLFD